MDLFFGVQTAGAFLILWMQSWMSSWMTRLKDGAQMSVKLELMIY